MNPPTTITMPPLMDEPSKKMSKTTLDYLKPLKKFLVFASGATVCKTAFTTLADIEKKIEVKYRQRIENSCLTTSTTLSDLVPYLRASIEIWP